MAVQLIRCDHASSTLYIPPLSPPAFPAIFGTSSNIPLTDRRNGGLTHALPDDLPVRGILLCLLQQREVNIMRRNDGGGDEA